MVALVTEQLACMLKCVLHPDTESLGVFPADRLPLRVDDSNMLWIVDKYVDDKPSFGIEMPLDQKYAFIVNTDRHDQPGQHWLAFMYNASLDAIDFFDSFGMQLDLYANVYASLMRNNILKRVTVANKFDLQNVTSFVCGQYALSFLAWRSKHLRVDSRLFSFDIRSRFSSPSQRDVYIVQHVDHLTTSAHCKQNAGRCSRGAHGSQTCVCFVQHSKPI